MILCSFSPLSYSLVYMGHLYLKSVQNRDITIHIPMKADISSVFLRTIFWEKIIVKIKQLFLVFQNFSH